MVITAVMPIAALAAALHGGAAPIAARDTTPPDTSAGSIETPKKKHTVVYNVANSTKKAAIDTKNEAQRAAKNTRNEVHRDADRVSAKTEKPATEIHSDSVRHAHDSAGSAPRS